MNLSDTIVNTQSLLNSVFVTVSNLYPGPIFVSKIKWLLLCVANNLLDTGRND